MRQTFWKDRQMGFSGAVSYTHLVFIAVGVKEIFNNFILFLFIHSEINLSDDDHLHRR